MILEIVMRMLYSCIESAKRRARRTNLMLMVKCLETLFSYQRHTIGMYLFIPGIHLDDVHVFVQNADSVLDAVEDIVKELLVFPQFFLGLFASSDFVIKVVYGFLESLGHSLEGIGKLSYFAEAGFCQVGIEIA